MGSVGVKVIGSKTTFNVPTNLTEKPKPSDIPLMRTNNGKDFIDVARGQAMMIDGVPVFLQKRDDHYLINVYGMIGGTVDKLADAKPKVKEFVERIKGISTSYKGASITFLEATQERFNFINVDGGRDSKEVKKHMDEWEEETLKKRRRR